MDVFIDIWQQNKNYDNTIIQLLWFIFIIFNEIHVQVASLISNEGIT